MEPQDRQGDAVARSLPRAGDLRSQEHDADPRQRAPAHRRQGQAARRGDRSQRDGHRRAAVQGGEGRRAHRRCEAPPRHREVLAGRRAFAQEGRQPLRGNSRESRRLQGRRHGRSRFSEAAEPQGSEAVFRRRGDAARHDRKDLLFHLHRRDALPPERRALRDRGHGRQSHRSHGLDRWAPPLEDRAAAARRAEARGADHHPAQRPLRAAPRARSREDHRRARRAQRPPVRARGQHHAVREAHRGAVPELRPGHPEGQRQDRHRAACRAAGGAAPHLDRLV